MVRGYIFGSALGDALGRYVEFVDRDKIHQIYGPEGIQEPPDPCDWTDDTQMMLAIADALLEGHEDVEKTLDAIADRFIHWYDDPGHAPGNTCMTGAWRLREGVHWSESGVADSKGCGSVMRSGVIGLFYEDLDMLKEIASKSGLMTHGHPTADAACIAGALAVRFASDPPEKMLSKIREHTLGISEEFTNLLDQTVELAASDVPEEQAIQSLGEGWVAEEAFCMAAYAVLKHPEDHVAAVRLSANITGDSDSVAAIAGGIVGLRSGFPEEWAGRLRRADLLEEYVRRIERAL